MDNGITKKGIFNIKVEPYLKPISDIGVGFYNLDENTATLRLNLYNTKGPLLIGENNVDIHAYFESSNGSVSGEIEVDIIDELNGIVEITLDKEFLQSSTSTTVKGQLYIGIHNEDNKPELNQVAVLREFNFEVADALINKISSFTKIEYIRMFDKLKEQIQQRVHDIEEAIANGEDYVAEMKNTLANGKIELNNIVTDGINNINNLVNQYKQDVLNLKNTVETNINTLSVDTINQINTNATNATDTVNDSMNNVINHVDEKILEFNTHIEENVFVQPTDLDNKLNELQWQKHKLTNDNGNANVITDLDMENIEEKVTNSGFYWLTGITNGPVNINGVLQAIHGASDSYKKFIYTPHNSNRVFLKSKNNSVWTDWTEISITQTDTGWLPITLKNGYTMSSTPDYEPSYRIIDFGTYKRVFVRIGVINIQSGKNVVASIPSNLTPVKHYGLGVSTIAKVTPKVVVGNGDIEFYPYTNDNYIETDYIIYEDNWII